MAAKPLTVKSGEPVASFKLTEIARMFDLMREMQEMIAYRVFDLFES